MKKAVGDVVARVLTVSKVEALCLENAAYFALDTQISEEQVAISML